MLEKLQEVAADKKRFPRLSKGQSLTADQKTAVWGVVRKIDGKNNVTVLRPGRFKKLVQPSAIADQVLVELEARRLLVKSSDGNAKRQLLIKGLTRKRARYICIRGLIARQA